jgi:uncharacterized protein YxjI
MDAHSFLESKSHIFIKQTKEWSEILLNLENKNRYSLKDKQGNNIGLFYEKGDGIFQWIKRTILRSHRPFIVELLDSEGKILLSLHRKFFWFFSDLQIRDNNGNSLGQVHRRFGFIYKKYDLVDMNGQTFARIKSAIWRLWTFKIYDLSENEMAEISKKWGGILSEAFTDSDQFGVSFGSVETTQKVVLLAAAISIDFDFFEDNSQKH